jgi:tetratricopeptide (TPR) repeat protein
MIVAPQLMMLMILVAQSPAIIRQSTSGWCSPTIANVTGRVTVNCIGVNPRALEKLNQRLNRTSQELRAKIDEANDWAERYHELEARLSEPGPNAELSHQAEEHLRDGDLDKAKEILDRILKDDEKEERRLAADHYNRGLIAELEFQPLEALPHIQKAYALRPENTAYAERYARLLLRQEQYAKAEPVISDLLERIRILAAKDPVEYDPKLGQVLHLKAALEADTGRIKQSEEDGKEELKIFQELAKSNPTDYNLDVSRTLLNLGNIYKQTNRFDQAEAAYKNAITIQRSLPPSPLNRDNLAASLNDYAILLSVTDRYKESGAPLEECVNIRRELVKENPAAYEPDLALALANQADHFREMHQISEAEKTAHESLDIRTRLAAANPGAYRSTVADTYGVLGNVYGSAEKHEDAQASYRQAADIYRELAKASPAAFEPSLANTLSVLGMDYERGGGKAKQAEETYEEALEILRRLAASSFEAYGKELGYTATSLAAMYFKVDDFKRAEPLFREAAETFRRLSAVNPAVFEPLAANDFMFLGGAYVRESNLDKSGEAAEEAIGIFKKLAAAHPAEYGDSLASCYFMLSQSQESKNPSKACELIGAAAEASQTPAMKQAFQAGFHSCSQKAVTTSPN